MSRMMAFFLIALLSQIDSSSSNRRCRLLIASACQIIFIFLSLMLVFGISIRCDSLSTSCDGDFSWGSSLVVVVVVAIWCLVGHGGARGVILASRPSVVVDTIHSIALGCLRVTHALMHHVIVTRVSGEACKVVSTWMMLICFFHTKLGCILVCKLELSLVALAFTTLRQSVYPTFLDAFAQVRSNMLGLVQRICQTLVLMFYAWETVCIQKQVRLLLLLLHEAKRWVTWATLLLVRRTRARSAHNTLIHVSGSFNLWCDPSISSCWGLASDGCGYGSCHGSGSNVLFGAE